MPNIWTAVDANFPTITEEEDVKEQLSKIVNYMFVLQEQLKYTLENLDQSNWNNTALKTYSEETTAGVTARQDEDNASIAEQIESIQESLTRMDRRISAIVSTVERLEALAKGETT